MTILTCRFSASTLLRLTESTGEQPYIGGEATGGAAGFEGWHSAKPRIEPMTVSAVLCGGEMERTSLPVRAARSEAMPAVLPATDSGGTAADGGGLPARSKQRKFPDRSNPTTNVPAGQD